MPRQKRYYVYILSSKGRVLYVGMTGFLSARMLQHKSRKLTASLGDTTWTAWFITKCSAT